MTTVISNVEGKKYNIIRRLGCGAFAVVYLCSSEGNSDVPCVIKEIILRGLTDDEKLGAKLEAELLGELDHACIVGLHESFQKENVLYIVMEHCNGGDISDLIQKQQNLKKKSKLPDELNFFQEHMILTWFIQIALGVRYIHRKNILHRDLKTKNIFITGDNIIKLGDFGISKVCM